MQISDSVTAIGEGAFVRTFWREFEVKTPPLGLFYYKNRYFGL